MNNDNESRGQKKITKKTLNMKGKRNPCPYCGHRCCSRKYNNGRKRKTTKRAGQRKQQRKVKFKNPPATSTEQLQVGSRCLMLSPLCDGISEIPQMEADEHTNWTEITPEIICESLTKLTMWREEVTTMAILEHIRRNYPVNQDTSQLYEELIEKLHIAANVGFVNHNKSTDCWSLNCALQDRKLTSSHVTQFWKMYADTLRPVTRKYIQPTKNDGEDNQINTLSPSYSKTSNYI